MAPRTRRRTGDGFSLVDLNPTLTSVTSSISDELSNQGVDIDSNALFMGIQSLVNSLVMNNPGALMASDDANKPPYNMAADILAIAYNHYTSGNKREAVAHFLSACEFKDAEDLTTALLAMNNASDQSKRLAAAEGDDSTDTTDDDEDDDGELSDEEIDDLIKQGEDVGDDDTDEDEDDSESGPMGGASSAKPTVPPTPPEKQE